MLEKATLKADLGTGCVVYAIYRAADAGSIIFAKCSARALLAEKLVESLEFETDPAIQEAWTSEAKKRRDAIRSVAVQTILGKEALAQVRRLLDR